MTQPTLCRRKPSVPNGTLSIGGGHPGRHAGQGEIGPTMVATVAGLAPQPCRQFIQRSVCQRGTNSRVIVGNVDDDGNGRAQNHFHRGILSQWRQGQKHIRPRRRDRPLRARGTTRYSWPAERSAVLRGHRHTVLGRPRRTVAAGPHGWFRTCGSRSADSAASRRCAPAGHWTPRCGAPRRIARATRSSETQYQPRATTARDMQLAMPAGRVLGRCSWAKWIAARCCSRSGISSCTVRRRAIIAIPPSMARSVANSAARTVPRVRPKVMRSAAPAGMIAVDVNGAVRRFVVEDTHPDGDLGLQNGPQAMLAVDQTAVRVEGDALVGTGKLARLHVPGQLGDVVPIQPAVAFVGIQPRAWQSPA